MGLGAVEELSNKKRGLRSKYSVLQVDSWLKEGEAEEARAVERAAA